MNWKENFLKRLSHSQIFYPLKKWSLILRLKKEGSVVNCIQDLEITPLKKLTEQKKYI